ncbi:MAG: ABC transporter permease, partial [Candidatus Poribacteria bacterium]|nr:ABC transporter permease [Candidatus Poribacteria bacterium]
MKLYEGISTGLASIFQEKLRSALTMLGIVIGVAAVLAMLAIGDGAKRIVTQEFEKYGSHFTVRRNPWIWRGDRVFPNRSGEHLKYEDVLAIEAECPAVESVIPSISNEVLAQAEGGAAKWTEYDGVNSYFPTGMKWQIQQGRFFSEDEFNNRRKVCVLGLEVATELFGNQHPIGTEIKISLQGGR